MTALLNDVIEAFGLADDSLETMPFRAIGFVALPVLSTGRSIVQNRIIRGEGVVVLRGSRREDEVHECRPSPPTCPPLSLLCPCCGREGGQDIAIKIATVVAANQAGGGNGGGGGGGGGAKGS